jgi:hypothetical protein
LRSEFDRRNLVLPESFDVPDRALWERGYATEARRSLLGNAVPGAGRLGVDQFDQAGELVGIGGGQDAVAQVKYVASAPGHGQDGPGLFG